MHGDDALIYSTSSIDHTEHVAAVLGRLKQPGLVINASKCQFGQAEVNYLGHKLSAWKVSFLPDKVSSVQGYPQPSSRKQLQSFQGLIGFYRRFVQNFSTLARPLYDLLKKSVPQKWRTEEK